jgi:hypothetical protein
MAPWDEHVLRNYTACRSPHSEANVTELDAFRKQFIEPLLGKVTEAVTHVVDHGRDLGASTIALFTSLTTALTTNLLVRSRER